MGYSEAKRSCFPSIGYWYSTSNDVLFWHDFRDGCCHVKLGYASIVADTVVSPNFGLSPSSSIDPDIWPSIWKQKIREKIKLFLWKACHNALPVKSSLTQKRIVFSNLCPIYHKEPETIEHTLVLCNWTELVWFRLGLSPIPNPNLITRFAQWLLNYFRNCSESTFWWVVPCSHMLAGQFVKIEMSYFLMKRNLTQPTRLS